MKRTDLQVNDDEAAQAEVVEEQVEVEILAADLKVVLVADEGKAQPQLQQEGAQMLDQRPLQVALVGLRAQAEEVEGVRVFQQLLGQLRLWGGQRGREVALGSAQPLLQLCVDLMHQDGAAPAVLDGFAGVPDTVWWQIEFFQQSEL